MNILKKFRLIFNKNNYEYVKKEIDTSDDIVYITYLVDNINPDILTRELVELALKKGYCLSNSTPTIIQGFVKRKKLLDDIKKNKDVKLDDLLAMDANNKSYLAYACKERLTFGYLLEQQILKSSQALFICVRNNYFDWIYSFEDEDVFFEEVENGKILIEYVLENNIKYSPTIISSFKYHLEIVDYLIKYKPDDLLLLSYELLTKIFIEKNNQQVINKYLSNEIFLEKVIPQMPANYLINYCQTNNRYDILKYSTESCLLTKLDNGKMVVEELLDRGIKPLMNNFYITDKRLLDILIKYHQMDILYKGDIELLLSKYNNDNTYFELMINEQKNGNNMHFEKMAFNYFRKPSKITAMELMKMAQNDIIGFVPEITDEMLLYKGLNDKKSVIEYLIEMDKDLTISKIVSLIKKKQDPNFVIVLRNLGIDDNNIRIKTDDLSFSDDYIQQYNLNYTTNISSICPELLYELKELFYQDGKSDKRAIDALITSYVYLTSSNNINNSFFILEIKKLIEIKKHNMATFIYKNHLNNTSFLLHHGGISLGNDCIGSINHETSHALHFYLADFYVPDNYEKIISNIRSKPGIMDRIHRYSAKYNSLKRKILSEINITIISEYYDNLYRGDKLLELSTFLVASKEEKKKQFAKDYQEQILDTILAITYSVDEFIKQIKETEKDELLYTILKNEYCAFCSVGDIIDAVFLGKLKNGVLIDQSGSYIEKSPGHGIKYYSKDLQSGFCEMIADYGAIIKSKNAQEMIVYLRSIVGDELVDMLKEVYEKRIINSRVYSQKEEEKRL